MPAIWNWKIISRNYFLVTLFCIGGSPKPTNPEMGYTIDTYNFVTGTETLNVTQMASLDNLDDSYLLNPLIIHQKN